MKDFFLGGANNRNSENKFLEVLNKWFFCQEKKSQFILFERTRLKKQKQTGKGAKQQRRWNKNSFTKKG